MLSTLREYAAQRLAESGEADSVSLRHALYFLDVARSSPTNPAAPEIRSSFAALRKDYENLRAALVWCLNTQHSEGPRLGLRLACNLRLFWQIEGYLGEAQSSLAAALSRVGPPEHEEDRGLYARALFALGSLEALRLAERDAKRHLEESLRIYRTLEGQEVVIAWVLHALGHAAIHLDDATRAKECYDEALAIYTRLQNKAGIARLVAAQADLAIHLGDEAAALELYDTALRVAREVQAPALQAGIHSGIGYIYAGRKQFEPALDHILQALEIQKSVDFGPGPAYAWALLGQVAYLQGHTHRSARIFGAAASLFDKVGLRLEPSVHTRPDEYEQVVANLRQALGEQAFLRAWERGQKSTPEQIERIARQCRQSGPGLAHLSLVSGIAQNDTQLTGRELEVLRLVAGGLTNAEVAEKLIVSPYTVNMHLRSIYSKLGVKTRTAATQRAMHEKLI
jgi:non-specific serine/threonine protein kinase